MGDIELEPHEWRSNGSTRVKPQAAPRSVPRTSGNGAYRRPIFTILAVIFGIWAGAVISVCRYWLPGQNPWIIAMLSLGPGALLFLLLIFRD